MYSKLFNILLVVAGVALIGNYIYRRPKYDENEKAPNFQSRLIDGRDFSLRDVQGSYVLLDFWGSWCGPCRKENPELVRLHEKFHNQLLDSGHTRFHIVSIGIETNRDRWERAILQDQLSWPHHILQNQRFNSPIAKLYGVREIPTKYLINPDGAIVLVNPTVSTVEEYLSNRLQK